MPCYTRRLHTQLAQGPPYSVFGRDLAEVTVPLVTQTDGRTDPGLLPGLPSALLSHCLLFPAEFILSLLEKMQTQEILRLLRLPELGDLGQFFRSLSATTLVSVGALAAVLAYWFTHRPKALQPPCNLLMQSEEVEVSRVQAAGLWQVAGRGVLKVEAKLAADLTQHGTENLVFPWQ